MAKPYENLGMKEVCDIAFIVCTTFYISNHNFVLLNYEKRSTYFHLHLLA